MNDTIYSMNDTIYSMNDTIYSMNDTLNLKNNTITDKSYPDDIAIIIIVCIFLGIYICFGEIFFGIMLDKPVIIKRIYRFIKRYILCISKPENNTTRIYYSESESESESDWEECDNYVTQSKDNESKYDSKNKEVIIFIGVECENDMECSICSSNFSELNNEDSKSKEITKLACGHYFHTECIKEWDTKGSGCPLCRKDINVDGFYIV